jgi:hypothetical protein
MVGLLKGLGQRFSVEVTVNREVMPQGRDGSTHEVFRVAWGA